MGRNGNEFANAWGCHKATADDEHLRLTEGQFSALRRHQASHAPCPAISAAGFSVGNSAGKRLLGSIAAH